MHKKEKINNEYSNKLEINEISKSLKLKLNMMNVTTKIINFSCGIILSIIIFLTRVAYFMGLGY